MNSRRRRAGVPSRVLVISLLALAVPVVATVTFPDWTSGDVGMLVWLTALGPAFLLTYYRGWWGVSVALAGGMAALALAQTFLVLFGLGTPDWTYIFVAVVVYLAVTLGAGAMADSLHRDRDQAAEQALTDELTRLPNRRHALVFLESAFAAAERGHPMTVAHFDLDDFKRYNDRQGHLAGDVVLKRFGAILKYYTRRMNLSARYGGEEFIAVLSTCRLEGAEIFARRILDALRSSRFPGGAVTASAGIAEFEPGMGSPEVLIAAADRALYECKAAGGDGYRMASRTLGAEDPLLEEHLEEQTRRRRENARSAALASGSGVRELSPRPWELDDPEVERRARGGLPGGDETILLVESDPDARRAMTALLERLGYEVVESPNGDGALERLRTLERRPDLLVTDLGMDDMSGFTLAKRAEETFEDLRVVYISHHAHGEVLWRGAPGRVRNFVYKPFDAEELARKVRRSLAGEEASVPGSAEAR